MSTITMRKIVLFGGASLLTVGVLAGCSPTTEKDAPNTTSSTASSSAPAVTPTEKAAGPGGSNSFSPTVNPNPPGAVCNRIVDGVCQR